MPDGGKGAFDRVGCADVFPMLGRVIVEGQQRIPVLDQLGDRLVPFDAIGFGEEVEGGIGCGLRLGLPDVVEVAFGLGLDGLRHRVQDVHGLVDPATLLPRRSKHLAQRGPEPQGTVADGKFRVLFQAAPLEIEQHLAPALRAFAEAVGHGQQLLAAIFIRPENHQNTLFFISHSRLEVDAIRPDVEKPPVAEIALLPSLVALPPIGLQPRDGLGR